MYHTVFVGGTFDALHQGHMALISKAFEFGDLVTIGLTSDKFVSKFKRGPNKAYTEREKALVKWLTEQNLIGRSAIIPIDNPYEPAASGSYAAIMVTSENRLRAGEINVIRAERGFPELAIIEVPLVNAQDGKPISSSRVREGEIDVSGHLKLTGDLRTILQKPLGKILSKSETAAAVNANSGKIIITVGDVTTTTIMKLGVAPALAVIDLKVQRQAYQSFSDFHFGENAAVIRVKSGPGFISREAIDAVKEWAKNHPESRITVLVIDGEEDLLALPAIVYAPMGSVVYYGQPELPSSVVIDNKNPNQPGLVEVSVDQSAKENALSLMAKFG